MKTAVPGQYMYLTIITIRFIKVLALLTMTLSSSVCWYLQGRHWRVLQDFLHVVHAGSSDRDAACRPNSQLHNRLHYVMCFFGRHIFHDMHKLKIIRSAN